MINNMDYFRYCRLKNVDLHHKLKVLTLLSSSNPVMENDNRGEKE